MIKVITTTSDRSKCHQLERSLKHFDYDYHIIEHAWTGFLSKIHESYKYLKSLEGYTHFIYTDAWDTFALRKVVASELPDNLLLSAERACYPHPEKESLYPKHESPWHFVNGGGWAGSIESFLDMYEKRPPKDELNDQVYLTDRFLSGEHDIRLDYQCKIFQTVAFCPDSDFNKIECMDTKIHTVIENTVTKSRPTFFHGNGHTPINWIYELI